MRSFLLLHLSAVLSVQLLQLQNVYAGRNLILGYISPLTGFTGFQQLASASTMAINQAKMDGYLNDTTIRVVFMNGACNGKIASGATYEMVTTLNVDGFVGIPCSTSALSAGKLMAYYNLPYLSYASVDPQLANKTEHSTLIRMMSPFNNMAIAVGVFSKYASWSKIVMVAGPQPDGYCQYSTDAIAEAVGVFNITIALRIQTLPNAVTVSQYTYDSIKASGRIVLVCGSDDFIRVFMLGAYNNSMTSGDYVFVSLGLVPNVTFTTPWVRHDQYDVIASKAYWPLLQVFVWTDTSVAAMQFRNLIPVMLARPPWNYSVSLTSNITGSAYAAFMYDVVYLYSLIVDSMIKNGLDYRNGNAVMKLSKQFEFDGKSGHVKLNGNFDRVSDYCVYHMPSVGAPYQLLSSILLTNDSRPVQFVELRNWGPSGFNFPKDRPSCGFHGELCQRLFSGSTVLLLLSGISVLTVSVIASVLFFKLSKYRLAITLLRKCLSQDLQRIDTGDVSDGGNGMNDTTTRRHD